MADPFRQRRSRRPRRSRRSGFAGRTALDLGVAPVRAPAPQPSGANRRLLLAASTLGEFQPEKLEVQDSQLVELTNFFKDNPEDLRERLGLSAHLDVATFLNPATMRKIMRDDNPESEARAIALHQSMSRLPPSIGRIQTSARAEAGALADPRSLTDVLTPPPPPSETLNDRARKALERAGYGGSEEAGDLFIPEFDVDVRPKLRPAVASALSKFVQTLEETPLSAPATGQIVRGLERIGAPTPEPLQRGGTVGGLLDELDVFSETTAELLAQLPKDVSDVEAPTLFTEGYGAALNDFQSRPLKEQMLLGLLDPTIFAGGGSFARKALTGSFDAISTKGASGLFAVEREAAEVLAKELRQSQLKNIVALPPSDAFLSRVNPALGGLGRAPGARRIAGIIDPSSQLHRLDPGSPERIALETNLIFKNADEAGEMLTELSIARVRERYDLNDLFGVKDGFADDAAMASKVTVKTGIDAPEPFFGNVVERPHLFNLNAQQQEAVDFLNDYLAEALRYFQAEGVKVEALGSFDDLFHMFPRRIFNSSTKKTELVLSQTPGRPRIGKHRTQEFMDAAVLSKGKRYGGPIEALTSYLRGGYNEVARIRAERHASDLFRSQKADRTLLDAKVLQDNIVRIQQVTIRDVNGMLRGFVPSVTTIAMYKRAFPKLATSIDAVTSFKPREFVDIIRGVSEESLSEAKLTSAKFEEIILGESRSIGRPPSRKFKLVDVTEPGANLVPPEGIARTGPLIRNRIFDEANNQPLLEIQGQRISTTNTFEIDIRGLDPSGDPLPFSDTSFKNAFSQREILDLAESIMNTLGADELTGFRIGRENLLKNITREQVGKLKSRLPIDPVESETFVPTLTVLDALKKAGVESNVATELERQIAIQAEKLATGLREESLRALRNRMQTLHKTAQERARSVSQQATFAVEAARRPGQTEKFSEFFQNKIIGDFKDENGNILKTGEEIATDLDRHLIDGGGGKALRSLSAINAALRFTKTAADFGAPFIQGLPMLFRDPKKWGEVTQAHFVAFKDPRVRSRYIAGNASDVVEMIEHGGMIGSSEFTEAMASSGWFARLPMQIEDSPLIPGALGRGAAVGTNVIYRTGQRFSNAFETFLDLARIETWKSLRPMAKNARDLDDLATFVNKLTGTTSSKALGVPLTQRQFEGAIPFFSPRYTRATAGLVLDMMRGGLRGRLARESIGRLMFGAAAVHVATQAALGQPIRLDPTNPGEFMRSDIAGQRIGFGGKFFSFFKSFVKISHQTLVKPEGYLSWNIFDPESYRDNPWLSTLRNQAAPLFGTGLSLAIGADPLGRQLPGLGDPIDLTKFLGEQAFPFWLDAAVEAGSFSGTIAASGAELGGGVAFDIPAYAERDTLFEKYAQKDFGQSMEQLQNLDFGGRKERRQLLADHPDLQAAQTQAELESRDRVLSAERTQVNDTLDGYESEWVESGRRIHNNLLTDVQSGDPRAQTKFRTAFKSIGQTKKDKRAALEAEHPEVFADKDLFFAEQAQGLDAEGNATLIAQEEFFDRITSGEVIDATTGRTDYIALDALRADIDAEFGAGMMAKIDKFSQESLDAKPLAPAVREYMRSFETLRPYWEAYKNVLEPSEFDDWLFFDSQSDDNQRKLMTSTAAPYRDLFRKVSLERRRIQSTSKPIDRALFQFYGFKPRNREHVMELVRQLRSG